VRQQDLREAIRRCQALKEGITSVVNCKRNYHPDALGRQVSWGIRQSIPDSR
jgi:hypothetical protein